MLDSNNKCIWFKNSCAKRVQNAREKDMKDLASVVSIAMETVQKPMQTNNAHSADCEWTRTNSLSKQTL